MINKHQFQIAAKSFRAGRLSLEQFTQRVFDAATHQTALQMTDQPLPSSADDRPSEPPTEHPSHQLLTGGGSGSQKQDDDQLAVSFSARPRDAHKGDFGKLLLIGGSRGMEGSISLSAMAALRAGAGLVKVAVPDEIRSIVAAVNPCIMTIGCHSLHGMLGDRWQTDLSSALEWADLIAIGPGLGRGTTAAAMVDQLYRESKLPMVIDADGLNALADRKTDLSHHAGHRVLTPHVGEFCRLVQTQGMNSREQLESAAAKLAKSASMIMVLKGADSLITDGTGRFHNQTGNPGMATAGSGDVLTGMIAALLATKVGINEAITARTHVISGGEASRECSDAEMQTLQRVRLAVHCHGLAGDLAIEKISPTALIATDLVDYLPAAIRQMSDVDSSIKKSANE